VGDRRSVLSRLEAFGAKLAGLLPSQRPRISMMPRRVATTFVENLFFLLSVLELEGIRYVVHYGTLLGAHRLGGVAPWDEDADIYILDGPPATVRARVESRLAGHGLHLLPDDGFFWVRQRRWIAGQGFNALHFLPPLREGGEGTPTDDGPALCAGELHPLRRLPFHSSFVWGPAAPDPILERLYGRSGSVEVMSRFRAAPIHPEAEAFWRRARPVDELPDWPAISDRFRRRSGWSHLLGMPWLWFNGTYDYHVLPALRGTGRRLANLAHSLR
jgi:LicD family